MLYNTIGMYITIFWGDAIVFTKSEWEPRFSLYLLENSESLWLSFGFLSTFQHHFISSEAHEQCIEAAHYLYAKTLLYIYFCLLYIECNLIFLFVVSLQWLHTWWQKHWKHFEWSVWSEFSGRKRLAWIAIDCKSEMFTDIFGECISYDGGIKNPINDEKMMPRQSKNKDWST